MLGIRMRSIRMRARSAPVSAEAKRLRLRMRMGRFAAATSRVPARGPRGLAPLAGRPIRLVLTAACQRGPHVDVRRRWRKYDFKEVPWQVISVFLSQLSS